MESPWPKRTVNALRAITFVCDAITFPIYYIIQQPWKYQRLAKRIKVSAFIFNKLSMNLLRMYTCIFDPHLR